MPCTYTVKLKVEVEDEAAAKTALKAMGMQVSRLKQVGNAFVVDGLSEAQKSQFKTEYAKAYSAARAAENFFELAQQEETRDEVVMVFRKAF